MSAAAKPSWTPKIKVQEDIAPITQAVRNLGRPVPDTYSFESSVNPETHDLHSHGCSELMRQTANSTRNAESLFPAAIAKDPNYGGACYRVAQTEYQELQALKTLTPADLVNVTVIH
jgi:hypothetical protein